MIIRIFDTAIERDDIEQAKTLFREQVRPVFERFEGCHGIDMHIGIDEHSKDLVEVAAISQWESMAAIEQATALPAYEKSLEQLRMLFQQTPIVRHFEKVE